MNLITKSAVKKYALELSQTTRAGKFTRVGKSFLEQVNDRTKRAIEELVRTHPTKGKTLQ